MGHGDHGGKRQGGLAITSHEERALHAVETMAVVGIDSGSGHAELFERGYPQRLDGHLDRHNSG